jgi:hypothetical protein
VFLIDFNVLYWFSVLGSKFQAFLRISLVNVAVGGEMLLPSLCFFIVYVWDFFLNRYFFVLDRISGSCDVSFNIVLNQFYIIVCILFMFKTRLLNYEVAKHSSGVCWLTCIFPRWFVSYTALFCIISAFYHIQRNKGLNFMRLGFASVAWQVCSLTKVSWNIPAK